MLNSARLLLLLGVALAIAGSVVGLIGGQWLVLPAVLIAVGLVAIIFAIPNLGKKTNFWQRRSTITNTNAIVATIALIVILGLVNFLAVRNPVRFDLTENQLYTLSPQTQQLVGHLSQPLKVIVFDSVIDPSDKQLLDNYAEYSDRFGYELVDPDQQITLAQQFEVSTRGEVYVQFGDRQQLVQVVDQNRGLSEVSLTNAIYNVQRDRTSKVYFLQGHGEASLEPVEGGYSQAVNALKERGYQVEPLNLATSKSGVPADAEAVIIAGPQKQLFEGEVEAIQTYLSQGGSLLVLAGPFTDPGLDPILGQWGVELDERLIIDPTPKLASLDFGPAAVVANQYSGHPITDEFANNYSVYPESRPVATQAKNNVEAIALVYTNEQSWAENNLESDQVTFDPPQDAKGPIDIGIALTKIYPTASDNSNENQSASGNTSSDEDSQPDTQTIDIADDSTETTDQSPSDESNPQAKMVVFGSSTFASNGWFEQQLNGDIFLNSVGWLTDADNLSLSIRPKLPQNRRINLTPATANLLGWSAIIIVPVIGLIAAAIAWWRRR